MEIHSLFGSVVCVLVCQQILSIRTESWQIYNTKNSPHKSMIEWKKKPPTPTQFQSIYKYILRLFTYHHIHSYVIRTQMHTHKHAYTFMKRIEHMAHFSTGIHRMCHFKQARTLSTHTLTHKHTEHVLSIKRLHTHSQIYLAHFADQPTSSSSLR